MCILPKRPDNDVNDTGTDHVLCSSRYATPIGNLTWRQTEDFFLLLSGEQRGIYNRIISCEYVDGNIPLIFGWTDLCPQVVRSKEFLIIPVEQCRLIQDSKFERYETEQRNHTNVPFAKLIRKSEAVPFCEGFAKWLKKWQDEA
jgi:hypothetical protein